MRARATNSCSRRRYILYLAADAAGHCNRTVIASEAKQSSATTEAEDILAAVAALARVPATA